jgi:Family of unknown function (DUF6527)
MNWFFQLLALLRAFPARWFDRPYKTVVLQVKLPEKLHKKTLYIVEEDNFEEQAAILCPRCHNHVLHMNLLPDERPCWKVTRHQNGTATLHPSVWRRKDCGVHFWFRHGRVRWVRDAKTQ